jgi:hypothetical protein
MMRNEHINIHQYKENASRVLRLIGVVAFLIGVLLYITGCGGSADPFPEHDYQKVPDKTTIPVDCGGGITCR